MTFFRLISHPFTGLTPAELSRSLFRLVPLRLRRDGVFVLFSGEASVPPCLVPLNAPERAPSDLRPFGVCVIESGRAVVVAPTENVPQSWGAALAGAGCYMDGVPVPWRLPTPAEWLSVAVHADEVRRAMDIIPGADTLPRNGLYWTSGDYDTGRAYALSVDGCPSIVDKTEVLRVRVVTLPWI